jgi:transposase
VIAQGYEFSRTCSYEGQSWQERVLVVRSLRHAQAEASALQKRLEKAQAALLALTPPVGRGKQQIRDKEELDKKAEAILNKYGVRGLLEYHMQRESHTQEKLVGRGRGGAKREKQVVEVVRYQITAVERNEQAIADCKARAGWRAYVTSASPQELSFSDAVLQYRDEYIVERGFGRFKGKTLQIAPMYVKRDDQVIGLARFLQLAVGVLALLESVVRRALKESGTKVAGLFQDSVRKETDTPTSERILRAFRRITLTKVHLPDTICFHVTPLNRVQQRLLELLGFPADLYARLGRTVPKIPSQVA